MVVQNKYNFVGVEVGLDVMWKYLFGDYFFCLDWCIYKEDFYKQYKYFLFG